MKTQNIKRSELKVIYDNVCEGWQNKIKDKLLWNSSDIIEVEDNIILQGYNEADPKQKELIKKYFKINTPKDLTKTLKTWEDVLNYANEKGYIFSLPYLKSTKVKEEISLNALCKIHLLAKVFNEGWIADFKDSNQHKYYPWFERKSSGWVFRGSVSQFVLSAGWGALSYFKNKDIANYIGNNKEFVDIYNEYLQ
jgi:hypothetical protein